MSKLNIFLDKLQGVRRTGEGRYITRCPSHADKSPSLSLKETNTGDVLLHCFAGCEFGSILAALDLRASDCFADNGDHFRKTGRTNLKYYAKHRAHQVDAELNVLMTRYGFSQSAAKALVRKALIDDAERAGRPISWNTNTEGRWAN